MPSQPVSPFLKVGLIGLSALVLASCGEKQQAQAPGGPPPPSVSVANPVEKKVVEWDEYTGRFELGGHG